MEKVLVQEKNGVKIYVGMIDVIDVIKNPHNPNVMSEESFNKLVESMGLYGNIQPVVVAPAEDVDPSMKNKYYLMDGHHRYDAAVLRGEEKILAIIVEGLNPAAIKAGVITFNTIRGEVDPQKLALALRQQISEYGVEQVRKWSMLGKDEIERLVGHTEEVTQRALKKTIEEVEKKINRVKSIDIKPAPTKSKKGAVVDLTEFETPLREIRVFLTEEDYKIVHEVLTLFSNDYSSALVMLCKSYKELTGGE